MSDDICKPEPGAVNGNTVVLTNGLLALLLFCLPWSSDFDFVLSSMFSQLYNLTALALILVWLVTSSQRWNAMPKSYLLFVAFIMLHNAVTWFVLHPGELTWQAVVVDQGVKITTKQSSAVMLLKNTIFMILGFALATQIRGVRQYKVMALALLSSLCMILIVGDVRSVLAAGERFVGGFDNPNAFADITALLLLLGAAILLEKKRVPSSLLLGGFSVVLALVLLLLSSSRGVIFAVGAGSLVYMIQSGLRQNFRNIMFGFIVIVGVLILTPSQAFLQLASRSETISSDNVRFFIWLNYLTHWKEFLWTGVGMGREMSLIDEAIKGGRIWNPHNTYLGQWVTMGVLGFGLLGNVLVSFWVGLRLHVKEMVNEPTAMLMASALIVFAIMLFFGDRLSARTTWVLLGILGGYLDSFPERKVSLSC